jgi:PAS domain S-box-containing protein
MPVHSPISIRRDLRALIERLPFPAAVSSLDEAARIVLVNDPFIDTFGYTLDDIPTVAAWAERAYPDDSYRRESFTTWNAAVAKARSMAGQVESMEFRVVCRDGTSRDVALAAAVTGRHLMVAFIDVSDLRRAENDLRTIEDGIARAAFELTAGIPVGTYVIAYGDDGVPRFTFVSERWLQMLDLRREDILADVSLAFRAVHPEEQESFIQLSDAAMARREPFAWEGRIIVRNEIRWVSIESLPRERTGGDVIWEGVMIDITRRKRAEAAISETHLRERLQDEEHRRALEAKLRTSVAAASTAGEILQPLGRILFETQVAIERLRDTPLEYDLIEDYLGDMLTESKHVIEMISQMKAMLRSMQAAVQNQ